MDELTRRAMAAYFTRGSSRHGLGNDQPGQESGLVEFQGKRFVVLRNVNGVLAVYRVRTSGVLKRLVRWPKSLEG